MTRWNGSLIGVQKNISLTDSTGVWNLRRQTLAKQNGVWPLDNSTIPQPNWSLDFSSGSPWANGTDYTFVSTASTSRMFVTSSGYIAPCVANLCLRSEEFNNAYYTLDNATVTANDTTAPDNTTTADLLKENSASNVHSFYRYNVANSSGTDYTFSVFAKSQNRTAIAIQFMYDGNSRRATQLYDLSGGAVSGSVFYVGASVTASAAIDNFGNGWYRCIFTVNVPAGDFTVFVDLSDSLTPTRLNGHPTYTGNGTDGAYIWGAQLVTGSAALPYSATTTSSNGIPRLTHNSSGSRLGLLVEGQRTNLLQRSEDLTNAYWSGGVGRTVATVTTPTAPDNAATAVRITETTANSIHNLQTNSFSVSSGTITFSAFVKKDTRRYVGLSAFSFNNSYSVIFDLDNGAAFSAERSGGTPSGSYGSEAFANGWYRVWVTMTTGGSGTVAVYPSVFLSDRSGFTGTISEDKPVYTGSTSESTYAWGMQIESSATRSSYIPTTTASVTRNEDKVHITKSKITNWSSPGAVCVHFYKPLQAGTLVSTDGTATEQLGIQASSTTAARAFWSSGQTATGDIGEPVVQKAVHYWDGTTSKFCINGTTVQTGTNNVAVFNNTNFITLGAEATDSSGSPGTFSNYANCVIRKVEFYAGQLTDTNLQEITQGDAAYPIEYLVVAGGGGGGSGNGGSGGGAGGYRTATGFSVTVGTSYTVTVGAGGASATSGNNSVFGTITSTGGGRGGTYLGTAAANGGSGGGAGGASGFVQTPGTGTAGQGNDGGANQTSSPYGCGGGGGASAVGGAPAGNVAGAGGAGTSSSITGTAVVRGGGGGGGAHISPGTGGAGGSGGGGAGGAVNGNGSAGSANTGGGGGGNNSGNGGGSGVVILRMPSNKYSGVYTGTPDVSQVGDDTVLVFNSSGSYRA